MRPSTWSAIISPFKAVIGADYKAVEERLLTAIHLRFGLPAARSAGVKRLIKKADRSAAFWEATRLAGFDHGEAGKFFGRPEPLPEAMLRELLGAWPVEKAQSAYLARFDELARSE
jgi:5'-deoxynucleotidase YfbR-like HD superfamily hydrolase